MQAQSPDLAAPARWHVSLRASRARRMAAARRRVRRFRARTLLIAFAVTLLVVSAGAAFASRGGSNTLRAVSPSGRYRGKYQFDMPTWKAWGGHGDPINNSAATQDRVALRLYKARGTKPWPNCA